ncbi:flagellar motor protein MotD [Pleionea sediminis]|uniref:flagellar motor protein MotD n=1 Tax=Pleionea sediminis TaxID=2569479 RepID=UPI001184C4B7|nr:flagellar motor protein MotD [Pleionea sediminis]
MLRKQPMEEEEKLDRWLVSYADFITLLFAFFVVMYSISQVNEGKYRILSQSLLSAFDSPERSMEPIQVGDINRSDPPITQEIIDLTKQPASGESDLENYASTEEFDAIEQTLEKQLADLIDNDLVEINRSKDWLEIDLRSALLFESGSDRLERGAIVVLSEIANTLKKNKHLIKVRGHSDNIPIETERFGSNWALSAGRAVAVVRLLQRNRLSPTRLAAEAFGEHQPVASNDNAEGRAKNRRVTIAISRYRVPDNAPEKKTVRQPEPKPDRNQERKTETTTATEQPKVSEKSQDKTLEQEESSEKKYEIIRLKDGGLIIRGKKLPEKESSTDENEQQDDQNP